MFLSLLYFSVRDTEHCSIQPETSGDMFFFLKGTYLLFVCVSVFAPQMGPPTHGGSVGAARSTSTGEAQGLESKNVPVASTGTALTPSTTATVTATTNNGKPGSHLKV